MVFPASEFGFRAKLSEVGEVNKEVAKSNDGCGDTGLDKVKNDHSYEKAGVRSATGNSAAVSVTLSVGLILKKPVPP